MIKKKQFSQHIVGLTDQKSSKSYSNGSRPTTKVSMSWSGGKDASAALWILMNNPHYEIVELHTVISSKNSRVSMHGISKELIKIQAESIGLPIVYIPIAPDATNSSYETALNQYYASLSSRDITHIGFGDIFLEDLKVYREVLLSKNGLTGVYPIWKQDTVLLSKRFITEGFKTIICASNKKLFNKSICGKVYDQAMLDSFPKSVDPCGENGEFHTYCFEGPLFGSKISVIVNEIIIKTYEHKNDQLETIITEFEFASIQLD